MLGRPPRQPIMPNAYISGTGSYVPPRVVSNDDLKTEFGIDTSHEWIHQRTGIETCLLYTSPSPRD